MPTSFSPASILRILRLSAAETIVFHDSSDQEGHRGLRDHVLDHYPEHVRFVVDRRVLAGRLEVEGRALVTLVGRARGGLRAETVVVQENLCLVIRQQMERDAWAAEAEAEVELQLEGVCTSGEFRGSLRVRGDPPRSRNGVPGVIRIRNDVRRPRSRPV